MSAFVLERKYALQLPNSFVDVDSEEMEYVDGGWGVPQAMINFTKHVFAGVLGWLLPQVFGVSSATASIVIGTLLDITWVGNALQAAAAFCWSAKGIAIITAIAFSTVAIAGPIISARRR